MNLLRLLGLLCLAIASVLGILILATAGLGRTPEPDAALRFGVFGLAGLVLSFIGKRMAAKNSRR